MALTIHKLNAYGKGGVFPKNSSAANLVKTNREERYGVFSC